MKRQYSHKYMCEAYEYWKSRLLAEGLSADREAGLKKAASKFAKWFGSKIKNGSAQRGEDNNFDALLAIKKTIKINSSEAAFKSMLKNDLACPLPKSALDQIASISVQKFCEEVFDGDNKCLTDLGKSIDLTNLKKSTPEFNYFANEVFQIWRRDPEIRATMGQTPDLTQPALDNQRTMSDQSDAEPQSQDSVGECDDNSQLSEDDDKQPATKKTTDNGQSAEQDTTSAPVANSPDKDDEDTMMNESIRMARRMANW